MNDETMSVGLLLESAQTHQKLVEENLQRLKIHAQDLDGIVRDEIRRTLVDELQLVTSETRMAAQALEAMRRAISVRSAIWTLLVTLLCGAAPLALLWAVTPSTAQIVALRAERDELKTNIDRLSRQGARLEWRHCGEAQRLCVRVERTAPAFGEGGDYFIVKGY